jgi:epoxyqueuosine reductase
MAEPAPDRLKDELLRRATALGFDRAGVAHVEPLGRDAEALSAFVAGGKHGQMRWLKDTLEVRLDPSHPEMLRGARSIVALATSYLRDDAEIGPEPGLVARYARGRDYHNVIGTRAKKLAAYLRTQGFRARSSVDSMPVLERAWAQRAGLGFIGKNGCLIVPGLGSHVLLATVITDAALPADAPMDERCGSCRRCLDACPTEAFEGERAMDARRCISYLTIEHRGPIEPPLRSQLGRWFLGCDVCQAVCPFNKTSPPEAARTEPFAPHGRWQTTAAELLSMDEARFDGWSLGSPVRRLGLENTARNAAYVLGNTKEKRHLPVLREAAERHPSAVVREAAEWAIREIE